MLQLSLNSFLKVETDAEREETDAAGLRFGIGSVLQLKSHRQFGSAGVLDGVFAIAAVMQTGADMLAEIGTQTNLPSNVDR